MATKLKSYKMYKEEEMLPEEEKVVPAIEPRTKPTAVPNKVKIKSKSVSLNKDGKAKSSTIVKKAPKPATNVKTGSQKFAGLAKKGLVKFRAAK